MKAGGAARALTLAMHPPVYTRRAKRKTIVHPKFYFFDAGVFRAIRPRGPLDSDEEIDGAALEILILQELRAVNDALGLGYGIHYWRTAAGAEVDFVLYGERGLKAVEVKRSERVREGDLRGLEAFLDDYPMAEGWLVCGVQRRFREGRVEVIPAEKFLREMPTLL